MPDWLNWIERKTSKPMATKAFGESNLEVGGSSPPSGNVFTQQFTKIHLIRIKNEDSNRFRTAIQTQKLF